MTTVSVREAAILAHLSKQPRESVRRLLTSCLGNDAKVLARSLNRKTAKRCGSPSRPSKASKEIVALRVSLRAKIAATEAQFDEHIKRFNCRLDSSGCTERVEFQSRLRALREILADIGGKEAKCG